MPDYRDREFEWDEAKSANRMVRSGFNFHFAKRLFALDRYVERLDAAHSRNEQRWIATGILENVFISVVYVERGSRKRIISAFESDDSDIIDYMVTHAIKEQQ